MSAAAATTAAKGKTVTVKAKQADILYKYLLGRLQALKTSDDPMEWVSCLFVLKTTFEKSPMPIAAEICFQQDIITTLLVIINRDFDLSDKMCEPVLYSLAMEMIWLLSNLERLQLTPMIHQPLVVAVTRFLDVRRDFFQFSPLLARKLHSLCHNTCFLRQLVSARPVTDEVWNDLLRYSPDMSAYGAVTTVHYCNLNIQLEGHSEVYSIAKRLVSDHLAWTKLPSKPANPARPVIKSITELIHPRCTPKAVVTEEEEKEEEEETEKEGSEEGEGEGGGGSRRQDVVVLNSIGGPYFWAYVGGDAPSTVQSISDLLLQELPSLTTFTPQPGHLVAVATVQAAGEAETDSGETGGGEEKTASGEEAGGEPWVMRGRVKKAGDDSVTVFAVDYGCVLTVKPHEVFELTGSSVCLAHFDFQAKVCCLAGIMAPPTAPAIVELALCTLTNLTKHFVGPGHMFDEAGGLNHLLTLLCVGPAAVKLQGVRLLTNLTSISRLSKAWDWSPFIRPLLGVLASVNRKEVGDNNIRNTVVASFYALTNILYCKTPYQQLFFQLEGQVIVLNLMRYFKSSIPITRAAAGLLRSAYPGLLRNKPVSSAWGANDGGSDVDETGVEEGERTERAADLHDGEEFSDEEINTIMQTLIPPSSTRTKAQNLQDSDSSEVDSSCSSALARPSPRHSAQHRYRTLSSDKADSEAGNNSAEEEEEEEEEEVADSAAAEREPEGSEVTCLSGFVDAEDESVDGDDAAVETAFKIVPVDGGTIHKHLNKETRFYEYNTFLPYRDDVTHHLWDSEDITHVSFDYVTQLVCGMLNSEGGTIYIGLTKTGCVRGIKLDRDTRDCVRLGLDNVARRPEPVVSHDQISVAYVEVGQRSPGGELKHLDERYVIEIRVEAPRDLMYFCVLKVCYVREDTSNSTFSEQDVRQLVVLDEERNYLPNLQRLQTRIAQLTAELEGTPSQARLDGGEGEGDAVDT